MQVVTTPLEGLLIIEPKVFGDERGFFFESFNQQTFTKLTGITANFVQDNHSRSARNVLRGLHYQIEQPQGKLVRVVQGEVFDVVEFGKNGDFCKLGDTRDEQESKVVAGAFERAVKFAKHVAVGLRYFEVMEVFVYGFIVFVHQDDDAFLRFVVNFFHQKPQTHGQAARLEQDVKFLGEITEFEL